MDDSLRLPTCSIGRAMEILGERWTLLILRECFYGVKRFSVMQRNLGIARNILSARLQLLVRSGILERRRYQDEPKRFEYKLTEKGLALYPAVVAIMRWGDEHLRDDGPPLPAAPLMRALRRPGDGLRALPRRARPARRDAGAGRRPGAGRTLGFLKSASPLFRNPEARMSVQDPTEQLWGGETTKAVANFPVSGERVPAAVVRCLGRVKGAAARVNADLGLLDAELAQRIAAAADEIARGEHDDQFPIDVFQTGSGTSTNMNANEVIATLAG